MKRRTKTPLMKEVDRLLKLPMPPLLQVYPVQQTAYEKKMAKIMQKFIDYQHAQAMGSIILKTPFGVLMWTPKYHPPKRKGKT